MKNLMIKMSFAFVLAFAASSANALSLLGQAPNPANIVNTGNGLEWVYAAPCAAVSPSCGVVQLHHGFRFATASEWLSSFVNLQGLVDAFNPLPNKGCSAPEFSTAHNHCDFGDTQNGYVWGAPASIATTSSTHQATETFLVRGLVEDIPEPMTLGLIGLGLAGLGFGRRRTTKA